MRLVVLAVLLTASVGHTHDLALDVIATATTTSENNPRAGSVGASLSGAYDLNDRWSAWGGFTSTRDLATRTPDAFTTGSTIFLLSAGAMFLATENFSFTASALFSPAVTQDNATSIDVGRGLGLRRNVIDLTVRSITSSFGGALSGTWLSSSGGDIEGAVDVSVSVNRFNAYQILQVPNTLLGNQWKQFCQSNQGTSERLCPLVNGANTPLVQARVGATGTVLIHKRIDVGLDAAVYVYDSDPNNIGYFSVVALGRTLELGNGVPVAPFLFSAKPFAAYRFERVTVKVSYQYGHFTGGMGRNHLVALRASFRITPEWRVSASLSGQADQSTSQLSNFGALATAGVLWVF